MVLWSEPCSPEGSRWGGGVGERGVVDGKTRSRGDWTRDLTWLNGPFGLGRQWLDLCRDVKAAGGMWGARAPGCEGARALAKVSK